MTTLEATGGPLECGRCGRPVPAEAGDWGGLMLNGRLVQLACPECLGAAEREEIAGRRDAALCEVVPGRRAGAEEAARLAALARERGGDAPPTGWFATLDRDRPLTAIVVEEPPGSALRTLWIGSAPGGEPRPALVSVAVEDWLALEEVLLPPSARELASAVAARA